MYADQLFIQAELDYRRQTYPVGPRRTRAARRDWNLRRRLRRPQVAVTSRTAGSH